ncbi:MAG: hypothetical protein Ct9H300mP28_09520 [Pseudomonadota bacterium]|nr:MAG: hypothetical protein Ct9H300mP28_09520 [Pseudomonadota bacterium]
MTKDLPLLFKEIETPLMKMNAPFLEGKKLCLVSILRAGMVAGGFMDLVPLHESGTSAYIGPGKPP